MGVGWLGLVAGFGGASLAFLWPDVRGGFGATFDLGTEEEIVTSIREGGGRYELPAARAYFVEYDPALDPEGQYADITNGTRVMALYQKCVHLGCKVPWCSSSRWWECPCHGSRYNRWGEWQGGPAPRGLDRFEVRGEDGRLILDTRTIVTGPSRASPVLNQPPEGPTCV